MRTAFDVGERFASLCAERADLSLYALVDGAQHQLSRGAPFDAACRKVSLFKGSADEPLADAGPWLVHLPTHDLPLALSLAALEREAPAVSWLIAPGTMAQLATALRARIDMLLPGGRKALLRFWDPRVLGNLAQVMDAAQRREFFAPAVEWHFLGGGERLWIGATIAEAG